MTISLIRYRHFSEVAELEPGTEDLRVVSRTWRRQEDGTSAWFPEVPHNGWYEHYTGVLVALFRDPGAPDVIWLQLGNRPFPLDSGSRSEFEPELANDDPFDPIVEHPRTFRLFQDDRLRAEHRYQLHDSQRRTAHCLDIFPSWPHEEEDYDLLFFVHRVLLQGRWPGVLRRED